MKFLAVICAALEFVSAFMAGFTFASGNITAFTILVITGVIFVAILLVSIGCLVIRQFKDDGQESKPEGYYKMPSVS